MDSASRCDETIPTEVNNLLPSRSRHELVDAQVELLCSYLHKRSPEDLLRALDRLIASCVASFGEEEALMIRLGGQGDPAHHARHETVIRQLTQLRDRACRDDRGALLAEVIQIDRELVAHLADAGGIGDGSAGPAALTAAEQH